MTGILRVAESPTYFLPSLPLIHDCMAHRRQCPRILIFNQEGREHAINWLQDLCRTLQQHGIHFDHAVFCTNVTRKSGSPGGKLNKLPATKSPLHLPLTSSHSPERAELTESFNSIREPQQRSESSRDPGPTEGFRDGVERDEQ